MYERHKSIHTMSLTLHLFASLVGFSFNRTSDVAPPLSLVPSLGRLRSALSVTSCGRLGMLRSYGHFSTVTPIASSLNFFTLTCQLLFIWHTLLIPLSLLVHFVQCLSSLSRTPTAPATPQAAFVVGRPCLTWQQRIFPRQTSNCTV